MSTSSLPTLSKSSWITFNAPPTHTISPDGTSATLRAIPKADWWRIAERHSVDGAFVGVEVELEGKGVFEMGGRLRVKGDEKFDQVGLLLYVSPTCWIKYGIECVEPGQPRVGCVVCDPFSDWAIYPQLQVTDTTTFSIQLDWAHATSNSPVPVINILFNGEVIRELPAFGLRDQSGGGLGVEGMSEGTGKRKFRVGLTGCSPLVEEDGKGCEASVEGFYIK